MNVESCCFSGYDGEEQGWRLDGETFWERYIKCEKFFDQTIGNPDRCGVEEWALKHAPHNKWRDELILTYSLEEIKTKCDFLFVPSIISYRPWAPFYEDTFGRRYNENWWKYLLSSSSPLMPPLSLRHSSGLCRNFIEGGVVRDWADAVLWMSLHPPCFSNFYFSDTTVNGVEKVRNMGETYNLLRTNYSRVQSLYKNYKEEDRERRIKTPEMITQGDGYSEAIYRLAPPLSTHPSLSPSPFCSLRLEIGSGKKKRGRNPLATTYPLMTPEIHKIRRKILDNQHEPVIPIPTSDLPLCLCPENAYEIMQEIAHPSLPFEQLKEAGKLWEEDEDKYYDYFSQGGSILMALMPVITQGLKWERIGGGEGNYCVEDDTMCASRWLLWLSLGGVLEELEIVESFEYNFGEEPTLGGDNPTGAVVRRAVATLHNSLQSLVIRNIPYLDDTTFSEGAQVVVEGAFRAQKACCEVVADLPSPPSPPEPKRGRFGSAYKPNPILVEKATKTQQYEGSVMGKLRNFELSNCKNVTAGGVLNFLERCPVLEVLDISGCPKVFEVLSEGKKEGEKGGWKRNVKEIKYCQHDVMEKGVVLPIVFSSFPSLTSLDLAFWQDCDDDKLKELLEGCNTLSSLRITVAPKLSNEAVKLVSQHPHLFQVDLSGCDGLTNIHPLLKSNKMTHITLRGKNLETLYTNELLEEKEKYQEIEEKEQFKLRHLDVSFNTKIAPQIRPVFHENVTPHLKRLVVVEVFMDDGKIVRELREKRRGVDVVV